jgi:hypothetical protein
MAATPEQGVISLRFFYHFEIVMYRLGSELHIFNKAHTFLYPQGHKLITFP